MKEAICVQLEQPSLNRGSVTYLQHNYSKSLPLLVLVDPHASIDAQLMTGEAKQLFISSFCTQGIKREGCCCNYQLCTTHLAYVIMAIELKVSSPVWEHFGDDENGGEFGWIGGSSRGTANSGGATVGIPLIEAICCTQLSRSMRRMAITGELIVGNSAILYCWKSSEDSSAFRRSSDPGESCWDQLAGLLLRTW